MKVDQLIIPVNEIKFIEVHKIDWIDIEVTNTTINIVKDVSKKEHPVTKTYNKRSLLGLRTKEVEVPDCEELPLVKLETVPAPTYSLTLKEERMVFMDTYERDYTMGLHYRELNGSSELTSEHLVRNHVPGSALMKLKSYIQDELPGTNHKIVEHGGKLRLRVGPYIKVYFNDKIGHFHCRTNADLMKKVAELSSRPELLHFY